MPSVSFGFTPATRRPYDAPLLRGVDGDTVNIDQAVRLVSIDTPESKLGGSADTAQTTLDRCRQRLADGTYDQIEEPLRQHLIDRLTDDAAQRHLKAGARAAEKFGTFWFYEGETLGFRTLHVYLPASELIMAMGLNSAPVEDQILALAESVYDTLVSQGVVPAAPAPVGAGA